MAFKFELKILVPTAVALTLGACSGFGDNRYGAYDTYGTHQANSAYGVNPNVANPNVANPYGGASNYGASTYSGQAQYGQSACASGPQGLGGLRGANGSPPRIYKSRYGQVPEGFGCAPSGYWVYPQQQYVVEQQVVQQQVTEQQITEQPAPQISLQPAPQPIVIEACPDGQYRASNGDCAILITEEPAAPTPIYQPPTYTPAPSFPISPEQPIISYEPVRK